MSERRSHVEQAHYLLTRVRPETLPASDLIALAQVYATLFLAERTAQGRR